jgi:hypothetical protein
MAMSGGLMFFLMMALNGSGSADLVSYFDGAPYFRSRSIEMKPEKMVELAGKEPASAKEEISRLLAIRWLGEHGAEVKKTPNARELLEQIAQRKKGKDPLGFARDYARLALARLDGKSTSLDTLPANSVRFDALAWFPSQCSLFGAMDYRPPKGISVTTEDSLRIWLSQVLGERGREEMYKAVEGIGNVRVDRISFGVVPDPNNDQQTRLYYRMTGKGDSRRILDFLKQNGGDTKISTRKSPDGEPIGVADFKRHGPAIIFIGNTDMVVAGFPGARGQVDNGPIVEEVLDLGAGKKKNLLTGPYAGMLRSTSSGVSGLFIGDLPEKWRKAITGGRGSPFRAVPQYFNLWFMSNSKGLRIRFTGSAANAREAREIIDGVDQLKQKAMEGLKKLPKAIKLKPKTVDALRAALKSVKLEARDALLTGSATVSNEALQGSLAMMTLFLFWGGDEPQPTH